MKVTNLTTNKIKFSDLSKGDVFTGEFSVYMKTDIHEDGLNAVGLENGLFYCFSPDSIVTLVDAELIIK